MKWGFFDSVAFAAAMTVHDMYQEENKRKIKTQKFYQECFAKIGEDSSKAFDIVTRIAEKASKCYMPSSLISGTTYLPLYCFGLVIKRQCKITHEQNKMLSLYFKHMNFPFSQSEFIAAARTGAEIADFRKTIELSNDFVGEFWLHFFRELYKSGTQEDYQNVVDCVTSIIMRFSVLGNPNSDLAFDICNNFVVCVNYQMEKAREISMNEIDWLGIIPITARISEMRKRYEMLIDNSRITEDMSKEDLLPMLDLLIMNSICDLVMLTKQPSSQKLSMINDAVQLSGIETEISPEEYVKNIANHTELGEYYKSMVSSGTPLGIIWNALLIMGTQADKTDQISFMINDLLSILLQIEDYLIRKYNFNEDECISPKYIKSIVEKLFAQCK